VDRPAPPQSPAASQFGGCHARHRADRAGGAGFLQHPRPYHRTRPAGGGLSRRWCHRDGTSSSSGLTALSPGRDPADSGVLSFHIRFEDWSSRWRPSPRQPPRRGRCVIAGMWRKPAPPARSARWRRRGTAEFGLRQGFGRCRTASTGSHGGTPTIGLVLDCDQRRRGLEQELLATP